MSASVEERLRRLEEVRYPAVGELNAQRTMLISAWAILVQLSSTQPEDMLKQLRAAWLPPEPHPQRSFVGMEPSEFEAITLEYEKSLAELLALLERQVRSHK